MLAAPPVQLPPVATTTADGWAVLMARQGVPPADWEPLRQLAAGVCAGLAAGRSVFDIAADLVATVGPDGPLRSTSAVAVLVATAVGTYCPERQDDLDRLLTEGLPRA